MCLKGTAEKHYKRWRSEHNLFPDAIGHHIQGVTVHDGDWDSHGTIKIWNYTRDGKEEMFKEMIEMDDEKMAVTINGLEGHVMEELKVGRNEDSPVPINYMKFVEMMVADMDDHILQNQE
ncbi:hypothetical protein Bca4012_070604 [Brassica carinata]